MVQNIRIGFEEKNEAILMVTVELTKGEVRDIIIKKQKISSADELAKLEKNDIVNIKVLGNSIFQLV